MWKFFIYNELQISIRDLNDLVCSTDCGTFALIKKGGICSTFLGFETNDLRQSLMPNMFSLGQISSQISVVWFSKVKI